MKIRLSTTRTEIKGKLQSYNLRTVSYYSPGQVRVKFTILLHEDVFYFLCG